MAEPTSGLVEAHKMAAILKLTTERLRQLAKAGAIPPAKKGHYPFLPTIHGYLDWMRDEDRRSSKTAGESAVRQARARQIELRTAQDQRELVPWQEAVALTQEIVGMLVARMQGLPAQVTRDPELRRKIEEAIDGIRSEVAARSAELAAGVENGADYDPSDPEANA